MLEQELKCRVENVSSEYFSAASYNSSADHLILSLSSTVQLLLVSHLPAFCHSCLPTSASSCVNVPVVVRAGSELEFEEALVMQA
jgi:hypothetical protein